ncbi:hypothetical protein CN947_23415 [Bacillus cereus]|nr:hypothetical protein CN947_23415 [Bacillus cereus]
MGYQLWLKEDLKNIAEARSFPLVIRRVYFLLLMFFVILLLKILDILVILDKSLYGNWYNKLRDISWT